MHTQISDSIRYVGVDNTSIHLFENQYQLVHGMSYNSYLILDEKVAILDTVESKNREEWTARLDHELAGRTPDYLIVHHMEPDHSSLIAETMAKYPRMQLVSSAKAIAMLPQFFEDADFSGRTMAVKDGDTLALGRHSLRFFTAPMIHWPEVVVSYDETDHVLFSADAFGKFGAISYPDNWINEARRYYINIVGKYGPQVQSLFKKIGTLDIQAIASLHGPVLRGGKIAEALRLYQLWSTYTPESDGIMVAYASIYGGTAECALRFAEMLREAGIEDVVTYDLCRQDMSEAVAQAFRVRNLVVASVTYDATLFPAMADFLHHLKIKNFQNRRVGIIENGSWAPIAGKLMREALSPLKGVEILEPTVTIKSRMHKSDFASMEQLCEAILK